MHRLEAHCAQPMLDLPRGPGEGVHWCGRVKGGGLWLAGHGQLHLLPKTHHSTQNQGRQRHGLFPGTAPLSPLEGTVHESPGLLLNR